MIRKYALLHLVIISYTWVGSAQMTVIQENEWKRNRIRIDTFSGWMWKPGQDSSPLENNIPWMPMQPKNLNASMADKSGKVEGWLKFQFRFDENFEETTLYFLKCRFEPVEIFINNERIGGFGTLNELKNLNNKHFPNIRNRIPYDFEPEKDYTLMVHVLDHIYGYPPKLKPSALKEGFCFLQLTPDSTIERIEADNETTEFHSTITLSVCFTLSFLMWLLYMLYPKNGELLFVGIFITMYIPFTFGVFFILQAPDFVTWNIGIWARDIFLVGGQAFVPVLISYILIQSVSRWLWINFILQSVIMTINGLTTWSLLPYIILLSISFILTLVLFFRYWQQVTGAKWAVFIGAIITIIGTIINVLFIILNNQSSELLDHFLGLVFPFCLVVYTALNFKQIMTTVQNHAEKISTMAREKEQLILQQNEKLEIQVNERTQELKTSLANLRSTQAQLIQSEKMASLGELTAGIAHEIQNPLNFVNNFSEVSKEMIQEMREEVKNGDLEEVDFISQDLEQNLAKIYHHGQRASAIVRSMLDHSRTSSGEKVETDINALCDEYLRLAYYGMRAKDKSFQAEYELDLDPTLPKINVIPQDIGRVLLNLINNAFQAVSDGVDLIGLADNKNRTSRVISDSGNKSHTSNLAGLGPKVEITTKKENEYVIITVSDNGPGIPDDIKDKIFQPFFTTKPTGKGTGLGLSLSYDIVKTHGGELSVESRLDSGTSFKVSIPIL